MKRKAERTKSLNCGNGGIRDAGQNKRTSVSEHENTPSCVRPALPVPFAEGPHDGSGFFFSLCHSRYCQSLKKEKKGNEIIRPPPTTKQHRQGRAALPTDASSSPHSAPHRTHSHCEIPSVCFHYHFESHSFGS